MPNRTPRRGRGFPPKRIEIRAEEGEALRRLLNDRHGYSAEEAFAGLLSGELATILIDSDDRGLLIGWLDQQAGLIEDERLASSVQSLARQLRNAQDLLDEER